ncbi:hypothetical protein GCM10012280_24990 [Wenjunlia tyrosinilytica]|uniref:Uncharacterized protein n=1 Tax=Wenjunlia tyrosinilytica TaxID=1544741 RepID=A0A917ZNU7_9ACTN|nr:hypothetical protein GCM10012280_24990 [Wenjunlia tyrosinilytica]
MTGGEGWWAPFMTGTLCGAEPGCRPGGSDRIRWATSVRRAVGQCAVMTPVANAVSQTGRDHFCAR